MNQIDLQELKESSLLLDDLLTEVIKEEGTLAGGRKLERGGDALLGVKESRLSLGHPTDNLVKLTAELFSEQGLTLNPIHRHQMESQFDFYYLTLTVLLMPKRGATFNMLECELDFSSENVYIQSIFPTSQWRPILESGSGLQLGLDANLEWVVGLDGKSKTHLIQPDFSTVRGEIAATGEGNHYCYWRISELYLHKKQSVQFAVLFKVPQGTKKIKLRAESSAKVSMDWLTVNLAHLFSELSQRFKSLFSTQKAIALIDQEEWDLILPDKLSQRTYTYHIAVDNLKTVSVQKWDTNGQLAGWPSGEFGFKGKRKSRIQELSQKVFESQQNKPSISEDEIFELGTELFDALFDDALRRDLLTLVNTLSKETRLRIELGIDEANLPEVAALPWEFLCVSDKRIRGELWLGTNTNFSLSRRRRRWNAAPPIKLKPNERLRIAVAVSAPKDEGPVEYKKLWTELEELAKENQQIELLDLVYPATRDRIEACLEQEPHIFHFIGHGRLDNQRNNRVGQLAITDDAGFPRWVNARRFSGLFIRHRPALVFLQACSREALSSSQAFAGVASQIVQQNIPVVVAMQYQINNANARQFTREFYTRLANFEPVDKCVQEGRYKISDWHQTPDFAIPVLFMRLQDGQLFGAPMTALAPEPESVKTPHTFQPTSESPKPKGSSLSTSQLRHKLSIAFDDSELSSFSFDYFPKLFDRFSRGMRTDEKISLLLDYCRRQPTGYQALLEALRQEYKNSYYPREELVPVIELLEASLSP